MSKTLEISLNYICLELTSLQLMILIHYGIIYIYSTTQSILAIMCPYHRYKQREFPNPWMTAEIYREIRNRSRIIKSFNSSRSNLLLRIDYCGFGPFCSTPTKLLFSMLLLKLLLCIIY